MDQRTVIILFSTIFSINALHFGHHKDVCIPPNNTIFFIDVWGMSGSLFKLIRNILEIHLNTYKSLRFYLIKENGEKEYISTSNVSLIVKPCSKTVIIIHGWQSNPNQKWLTSMAYIYFKYLKNAGDRHDINIIIVDWHEIADNSYILGCLFPVPHIGKKLADLIFNVYKNSSACAFVENIVIIGHSCGCHIAGYAGKAIQKKTNNVKIGKIVCLDAAGPCFDFLSNIPLLSSLCRHIQKSDAKYVYGFLTNAGFLGTTKAYGDVNVIFYGGCQPNCAVNRNFLQTCYCSHHQAVCNWIDSIVNPDDYLAKRCKSDYSFDECNEGRVQVGEHTSPGTRGNFFLSVSANCSLYDD